VSRVRTHAVSRERIADMTRKSIVLETVVPEDES
jgi:hypothetical protein